MGIPSSSNISTTGTSSAQNSAQQNIQNNVLQSLVAQALGSSGQIGNGISAAQIPPQTGSQSLQNAQSQPPQSMQGAPQTQQVLQQQNASQSSAGQLMQNQQLQQLIQQRNAIDQQIQALQGQVGGGNGGAR